MDGISVEVSVEPLSGLTPVSDGRYSPTILLHTSTSDGTDPENPVDLYMVAKSSETGTSLDKYFFPIYFQCDFANGAGWLVMVSSLVFLFDKKKGSKFGKVSKAWPINVIHAVRAEIIKKNEGSSALIVFFSSQEAITIDGLGAGDANALSERIDLVRAYRTFFLSDEISFSDLNREFVGCLVHDLFGILEAPDEPSIEFPKKSKRAMIDSVTGLLPNIRVSASAILDQLLFAVRRYYQGLCKEPSGVTLCFNKATKDFALVKSDDSSADCVDALSKEPVSVENFKFIVFVGGEQFSNIVGTMFDDIYFLSKHRNIVKSVYMDRFIHYNSFYFPHPLGFVSYGNDSDIFIFDIVLDSLSIYKYDPASCTVSKYQPDLTVVKYEPPEFQETVSGTCLIRATTRKGDIQVFRPRFNASFRIHFEASILIHMAINDDFSIWKVDKYDVRHLTESIITQLDPNTYLKNSEKSELAVSIEKWNRNILKQHLSEFILPLTDSALVHINSKAITYSVNRRDTSRKKIFFKKIIEIDREKGKVLVEGSGKRRFLLDLDSVLLTKTKSRKYLDDKYRPAGKSFKEKGLARESTLYQISLKKRKSILDYPIHFSGEKCSPKVELFGSFLYVYGKGGSLDKILYLPRYPIRVRTPGSNKVRIMQGTKEAFEKFSDLANLSQQEEFLDIKFSDSKEYSLFLGSLRYLEVFRELFSNEFGNLFIDVAQHKKLLRELIIRVQSGRAPITESVTWRRRLIKALARLVAVDDPKYESYIFYNGIFCGVIGDIDYENNLVHFRMDEHSISVAGAKKKIRKKEGTVKISQTEIFEKRVLQKEVVDYGPLIRPLIDEEAIAEISRLNVDNGAFLNFPPVFSKAKNCTIAYYSFRSDKPFKSGVTVSVVGWRIRLVYGKEILWSCDIRRPNGSKILFLGKLDTHSDPEAVFFSHRYGTIRVEFPEFVLYRRIWFTVKFIEGLYRLISQRYQPHRGAEPFLEYVNILKLAFAPDLSTLSEDQLLVVRKYPNLCNYWNSRLLLLGLRAKLLADGIDGDIQIERTSSLDQPMTYVYFYKPFKGLEPGVFYPLSVNADRESGKTFYIIDGRLEVLSLGNSFEKLQVFKVMLQSFDEVADSPAELDENRDMNDFVVLRYTPREQSSIRDVQLFLNRIVFNLKKKKKNTLYVRDIKRIRVDGDYIVISTLDPGAESKSVRFILPEEKLLVWLYALYFVLDYQFLLNRNIWERVVEMETNPIQKYFVDDPEVPARLFLYTKSVKLDREKEVTSIRIDDSVLSKAVSIPLTFTLELHHPQYDKLHSQIFNRFITSILVLEYVAQTSLDLTRAKIKDVVNARVFDSELNLYASEMEKRLDNLQVLMKRLFYKHVGEGVIRIDGEEGAGRRWHVSIPGFIDRKKFSRFFKFRPQEWNVSRLEMEKYWNIVSSNLDVEVRYPYFYLGRHDVIYSGSKKYASTVWILNEWLFFKGTDSSLRWESISSIKVHGFDGEDFVFVSQKNELVRIFNFKGEWDSYSGMIEKLKKGSVSPSYYSDMMTKIQSINGWLKRMKLVRYTYIDSILFVERILSKTLVQLDQDLKSLILQKIPPKFRDIRILFVPQPLYLHGEKDNVFILSSVFQGKKPLLDGGRFYQFVFRSKNTYLIRVGSSSFILAKTKECIPLNVDKEETLSNRILNNVLVHNDPVLRLLLRFNTRRQDLTVSSLRSLYASDPLKLVIYSLWEEIANTPIEEMIRSNSVRSKLIIHNLLDWGMDYVKTVLLGTLQKIETKIKEEIRSRIGESVKREQLEFLLGVTDFGDLCAMYSYMNEFKVTDMSKYILSPDDNADLEKDFSSDEVARMRELNSQLDGSPRPEITRDLVTSSLSSAETIFGREEADRMSEEFADMILIRIYESFDELPSEILEALHAATVQLKDRFGEKATQLGINSILFLRFLNPFITFANQKFVLDGYLVNPIVHASGVNFRRITKAIQFRLNRMDSLKDMLLGKKASEFEMRVLKYVPQSKREPQESSRKASDFSVEAPLKYVHMPDQFLDEVNDLDVSKAAKSILLMFLHKKFRV